MLGSVVLPACVLRLKVAADGRQVRVGSALGSSTNAFVAAPIIVVRGTSDEAIRQSGTVMQQQDRSLKEAFYEVGIKPASKERTHVSIFSSGDMR